MSQQLPSGGMGLGVSVKVTNITPRTEPSPSGGVTKGSVVTFQLSNGHAGTVFVPDAMMDPDTVRQIVMDEAWKLAQVANIAFNL